ncbi:MAG: hypothetical protein K8H88_23030 [Sandaracinaceae bacterium]|nr:hypothetical protein [Sandaracinaceae bacterium]
MDLDRWGTGYLYDQITGPALGRCAFLGYRVEAGARVDPTRTESFALLPEAEATDGLRTVLVELGVKGLLTGLWWSPSDRVFATDLHGRVYVRHTDTGGALAWSVIDLGADVEVHGVWGVDDQRVFVWGRDATRSRMWFLHGTELRPMAACPGDVTLVRGTKSCLYAAGAQGLVAKWAGDCWERCRVRTLRPITGLCVVDEDELWATTDNGKLFEGTSHGWALRAQYDAPLCDVARWNDRLYVAAKDRGLLELIEGSDRFRVVSTELAPLALEAREMLLALGEDTLAASWDGKRFEITCRAVLRGHCERQPPVWRR